MSLELVPTATAAFIAGLSDRQMQRVVDEEIIGSPLVRREGVRGFAVMTTALAKFYFATNNTMTKDARLSVMHVIIDRVSKRKDAEALFSLKGSVNEVDWTVDLPALHVQLGSFVTDATDRVRLVRRAEESIVEDPDVMGGTPVFKSTRVPVATVAASQRAGFDMEQLREAYPFLTPELVLDAETYLQIHPKVGRPRKDDGLPVKRKLVSSKRVAIPDRR
jgi:uncharacterized protein (DUF433 family)